MSEAYFQWAKCRQLIALSKGAYMSIFQNQKARGNILLQLPSRPEPPAKFRGD